MPLLWLCLLLLPACATPTVARSLVTMGTTLEIRVEASSPEAAAAAAEAAARRVLQSEQRFSSWREDSQLSRMHATADGAPVAVDAAFARGLALASAWTERTGAAFDPWLGAGPGLRPVDAGFVRNGSATLHEGGFVKGYALDAALALPAVRRATRVELDLGGQFAWRGPTAPPPLAVAHPTQRHRAIATLALPPQGSVATSGTSERGAHIRDPRTGRPAADFGSVTVLATGPDAACAADCLSTALYVLGPDRGLALVAALPNIEALFAVRTDAGVDLRASRGLRFTRVQ